MFRELLIIFLMLSLSIVGESSSSRELDQAQELNIYFPVIAKPAYDIELVVTESFSYYSNSLIYGYIINHEPGPLFSVMLGIQTTEQATEFCESPADPHYPCTRIQIMQPMLEVTFPNQANPFRFGCYEKGAPCFDINDIYVVSASRIEPGIEIYHQLKDIEWDYTPIDEEQGTLSGIIHNDSKKTLHNMTLLVFGPCTAKNAQIAAETLKPGRRTSFELTGREECLGGEVMISGQGTIEP